MNPVPCVNCGYNFMRQNFDPNAPRICNSCEIREQNRIPKGQKKMDTIDVLVKCPSHIYKELEEICISDGTNPSEFFLNLYYNRISRKFGTSPVKDAFLLVGTEEEIEEKAKELGIKDLPNKGKKKS